MEKKKLGQTVVLCSIIKLPKFKISIANDIIFIIRTKRIKPTSYSPACTDEDSYKRTLQLS